MNAYVLAADAQKEKDRNHTALLAHCQLTAPFYMEVVHDKRCQQSRLTGTSGTLQ
jgi:hypothetical protein